MAKRRPFRRSNIQKIKLQPPKYAPRLYILLAVSLLPWTIYLGLTLPQHHLSSHWDISWTGLDIGLIVSLTLTGVLARIRSIWVIISASTTGSLLLVDAWFDIMSERGQSFHQAIAVGILLEIPLAILSYHLAFHAVKRVAK